MKLDTITAAARILADLRTIPTSPACLWFRIPRATRAAAFRHLAKRGLIEVAYLGGDGNVKNWRLSERGRTVQPGEEMSAVL